ncbi:MAG: hypothetical protein GY820_18590, partial [Gammaproteobacteria bacterium]|nr:hypothetical protein [Gammaproteobacteria bacterium]
MDFTKTPLCETKPRKPSKKHDLGEIVQCFVCNRRVGVAKAISCTDCWRHRHRRCLNFKVNGVGKCLACTSLTLLANSPDQSYFNKILGSAYSGLEEEDDSDENSLRSKGGTASSHQSSVDSDAGEDTVTYCTRRDEIWQV